MKDETIAVRPYRLKQPIAELRRKAVKAVRRQRIWTAEEIDYADVLAMDLYERLNGVKVVYEKVD